jgi:NodT family efflux transporter outer membrane factor (OMF) lipoprotein
MNRRGGSLVLMLLLTSCATAPDKVVVEDLPQPADWSAAAASTNAVVVSEGWWTTFGSASLNATVAEALRENHDLKQALARVDAAVAQARIAGADLQPQVGFNFDAARSQQVFVGLPIPGGPSALSSEFTSYGAGLNVTWELDVWGRIRAGQSAALANVQASESDYRGAMESLAAQTARAWVATIAAAHQLRLARATEASFRLTAEQIGQRYRSGLRSALDYRFAMNNHAAAKALVSLRERERQMTARQLEILLGRYPGGGADAGNELPVLVAEVPAGLPSGLLERRPDLASAERRLAASLARVKEAKRALLPRISLTAGGGRTSAELADLLDSSYNVWNLAGNFAQPLLQGGRLRANVKLAEARAREALEAYHSVVLRAFGEVEIALDSERQLREREEALADAALQSSEALRLAEERYFAGLIEFVTLMEAQRGAFNAETELIRVRQQRLDNRVDLHLALGGGFPQETTEPVSGPTTEE